MAELILFTQLFSTLSMVGVIWFVQIVHYPLFALVGREGFTEYERRHQQRTTIVAAPFMLAEALNSVLLVHWRPDGVTVWLPWVGLLLVAVLWGATFFWLVPAHEQLAAEFDSRTLARLVRSNWLRTAGWTARGLLVCGMCCQTMS